MFATKIKNKYKIILFSLIFGVVFLAGSFLFFIQNIDAATTTSSFLSHPDYKALADVEIAALTNSENNNYSPPMLLNFMLWIASGAVTFFGWLIQFAIFMGKSVIALPIVQSGSQTMISFANLGFVFAIIVIAFATIFRVQSYSMKQILWKLIVAALLINFSLTIAGAFISVANIFTDFFLQSLGGKNVADGLMGVLNPQQVARVGTTSEFGSASGIFNYIFKYMASILFAIVVLFVILLTFLALAIMLLIRTIILGILLIIMPIVWLLWIFPGTQKYWSEWWSNFIRWTFFAPIVLFFVVLVISGGNSLQNIRQSVGSDLNNTISAKNAFEKTMTFNPNFFDHVAQVIVATGLLLGGLFAANKMGITFASTAMGWAQNSGKMFGGWAGRRSLQAGTGWLNKPRGKDGEDKKSYAKRFSDWSSENPKAAKIFGMGLAARGVAKFAAAGGENLVKKAKKEAGERSLDENIAMLGYVNAPARQGILTHLWEKKLLDRVPNVLKYIDQKTKDEFAVNGQAPAFENIEKTLGMNVKMKEYLDGGGTEDMEKFYKEGEKFFSKFSNDDWKKTQFNSIFSGKPSFNLTGEKQKKLQEGIARSIISSNPGNVVKVLNNVKPENFGRAHSAITRASSEIRAKDPMSDIPGAVSEVLRKTMAKRLMGESLEFPGATETEIKAEV